MADRPRPGGGTRVLRVDLHATARPGVATLVISDNGHGIPPDVTKGTGTRIIELLAEQVGAEIVRESSDSGTTVQLVFSPRSP